MKFILRSSLRCATAAIAIWAATGTLAAPVRIAILAAPDLEPEELLLTTRLSSDKSVEILERKEIDRVFQEQNLQLAGLTGADCIRVGQLLQADGLMFLEKNGGNLSVWIVAVQSGIDMAWFRDACPISKVEDWASARAADILRLAPGLTLPRASLTAISLMKINAAVGGGAGRILEDTITTLLRARLMAEPGTVVLERDRMADLADEKKIGAQNSAFWNSSWILAGSVTPSEKAITLELSLQQPNHAPASLSVSGPDVSSLVEAAAAAIMRDLGKPSTGWNPSQEAARFAAEARWAYGNRLWDQAARAVEAAVALGDHSASILDLRRHSYESLAMDGIVEPAPQSDFRLLAMARCLQLAREEFSQAVLPSVAPPWLGRPRYLVSREEFTERAFLGQSPGGSGAVLLDKASDLLERAKASDSDYAVQNLRDQMYLLFSRMEAEIPALALKPAPAGQVPPWDMNLESDRNMDRNGANPDVVRENIHTLRVNRGLLWESDPDAFFAYARKCLASDLPADEHFYQRTLESLSRQAERAAFPAPAGRLTSWKTAGDSMAADPEPRVWIGGAFLLSRCGDPIQCMQIFLRNSALVYGGKISPEYLTHALKIRPPEMSPGSDHGASTAKATEMLADLAAGILQQGGALSPDVMYGLNKYRYSRAQAGRLLALLQDYMVKHSTKGADALVQYLKTIVHGPEPQAIRMPVPSMPSATPGPAAPETPEPPPFPVDRAWVADNYDDPSKPGIIRYAVGTGDAIWLQVEYPPPPGQSAGRREFIRLELPSMKSKVVFSDIAPAIPFESMIRGGPWFATDGQTVYFRDGKGAVCLRDGKAQTLNIPGLTDPLFWLVNGMLYIVDRAGVLIEYNPATGSYAILASNRRRPAQSPLDDQVNLNDVERVFRGPDGNPGLSFRNHVVFEREASGQWEKNIRPSDTLIPGGLNEGSDTAGVFVGGSSEAFLNQRDKLQSPPSPFGVSPAARYMGIAENGARHAFIRVISGMIHRNRFWSLVGTQQQGNKQEWLLCIDLSSNAFACHRLDFSPEFEAAVKLCSGDLHFSAAPTPHVLAAGGEVAIYSQSEPVLWLIPQEEFFNFHPTAP